MFPIRDENPSGITPWVTIVLITLNIVCFARELALGPEAEAWIRSLAIIPADWSAIGNDSLSGREVMTLWTSMFLHGGIGHIVGNLWYLWIFGDNIEAAFGHVRYLVFYLLGGAVAGLVHIIFNTGSVIPTIGASGAVSAVLGAYLLLYPHVRVRTLIVLGIFIDVIRVRALILLGLWFALQALGTTSSQNTEVAFAAHIGGFLAGVLVGALARPWLGRAPE